MLYRDSDCCADRKESEITAYLANRLLWENHHYLPHLYNHQPHFSESPGPAVPSNTWWIRSLSWLKHKLQKSRGSVFFTGISSGLKILLCSQQRLKKHLQDGCKKGRRKERKEEAKEEVNEGLMEREGRIFLLWESLCRSKFKLNFFPMILVFIMETKIVFNWPKYCI